MSQSVLYDQMNITLANAIVSHQKLQHYHWRVAGDQFFELHEKFERLYTRFAGILDDVAERLLMAGGAPIKTLAEAIATASISEDAGVPGAREMASRVLADLQTQRTQMLQVIAAAEREGDRSTINLLDGIADDLDKEIWMLRSYLAD